MYITYKSCYILRDIIKICQEFWFITTYITLPHAHNVVKLIFINVRYRYLAMQNRYCFGNYTVFFQCHYYQQNNCHTKISSIITVCHNLGIANKFTIFVLLLR